jgi:heparosan-N-sulfate-glucuronate 5-epimerase
MHPIASELARMFPLTWRMRRAYVLPTGTLGEPFFVKWDPGPRPRGEGWIDGRFDERGLFTLGSYRNPVQIAQYALYRYDNAAAGDPDAVASFLAQADWLVRAQASDGTYRYDVPAALYSATTNWISGMAQGEAAAVLLRAYALTANGDYLKAGARALSSLFHDVRTGGASFIRGDDVFFEEAAVAPECHILNGHLYAAFAVWEYARHVRDDQDYAALHHDAQRTLNRWLSSYDDRGWSCYDLAVDDAGRRHYAPLWYHHFHIAQLRIFTSMTGDARYAAMAARWNRALSDYGVRARVWSYSAQSVLRAIRRRIRGAPVRGFVPLPAFRGEPMRS